MIHRLASKSVLLIALTASAVASAEPQGAAPSVEDVKAAESDFNRGREAYKAGNYTEAAEYFESADSHAPNERVLELAIGARDKAGVLDRAATLAQLALERHPNSDRIRKVAAPLVDKARVELLSVVVECDEPCNVLDGARIIPGAAVSRRMIFLPAGERPLRASWSEGRGLSKDVSGKAGEAITVQFAAPPIPETPVPVAPSAAPGGPARDGGVQEKKPPLPPLYFIIGAGATAALGGVTIWSGIDTVNNPGADVVKEKCAGQDASCPEYKDGRSRQLRTNILIAATSVVGAATAVVGAFFTDWSGSPDTEASEPPAGDSASVSPFFSYERGPTIGAVGRF